MRLTFLLFILFETLNCFGQFTVSGYIKDDANDPIPDGRVFIKNDPSQRTKCDMKGFYSMQLIPGEYYFVVSSTGFETREFYLTIIDKDITQDFQLFELKVNQIEDVEIKAKKTNVGREIMLKVVDRRETMDLWNYPHICNVYIKAVENIKSTKIPVAENNQKTLAADEIDEQSKKENQKNKKPLPNTMNLCEIQLQRNYQPPNKVKEIRNAYELRGSDYYLYYTTTVKSNFNFFDNLLQLNDLHATPIQSPISTAGIISYRYKLVDQYLENGVKIHKIKISSRQSSTSTLEGFIYVIDSIWLVQKIDLTLNKGNLLRYDKFNVQQTFSNIGDSLCLLDKQILTYSVKNKSQLSDCITEATFDNYDFGPNFGKKYFNSEVALTTEEAFERDTSFWNVARKTPLSIEEIKFIKQADSLKVALNKKEYLDSVDKSFNKITFLKVIWWGIDHRNRAKGTQWWFSSIAATSRPIYIAGPRVAPSIQYFKRWKNMKFVDSQSEISYGFLNKDIKGKAWIRHLYNPFKQASGYVFFSHDYGVIRTQDAITQIFKRDNFIEATSLNSNHSFEVFNGFYLTNDIEFTERRSVKDLKFLTILDKALENNTPSEFKSYQAFITRVQISYTPFQQYMREPRRKVILGSKFPTFALTYEKGIYNLFGSDVDHDYIKFSISQNFKLLTFGTSSYFISTGKFLNTKRLQEADKKFHRRSDPIFFSNPLYTFQNLQKLYPTNDIYYEGHFVHHDNGAIINKIPGIKFLRISLVGTAGILYIPQFKMVHYELALGLERTFKFSRRRLRVGFYGVASAGNQEKPGSAFKVSFAMMDDNNMKFNF